jgi:hypothetical protein
VSPRRPRPVTLAPRPVEDPQTSRRRAAFDRAWPLLATSIPTADIVESYLLDVLAPS